MSNYNFESKMEEFGREVRELYERMIPMKLREAEKQLSQKKGEIKFIFKQSKISGIAVVFHYNQNKVLRIKELCYRHETIPEWNPDKKWWKMPVEMLGETIFAFPNFDLHPKILEKFPKALEIQEIGFRSYCYLQVRISVSSALQVLDQHKAYEAIEPEAKAIGYKMGFTYANWEEM